VRLISVDREGWVATYDGLADAEYLEWIDVADGEYLLIDDDGFLYEPHEASGRFYGYEWRRTANKRPELLAVLKGYDDNSKMTLEDLRKCRSDIVYD
jgi:hypothetical protein